MNQASHIAGLKSQREEVKDAIAAGNTVVYGYLRAKSSSTAKAGSLYYVGIASTDDRPYHRHTRGSAGDRVFHDVPVPADHSRIRLLATTKTRKKAEKIEIAFIARFGRKGVDACGILLNRTIGGEGVAGRKLTKAQRKRLDVASAKHYGMSYESFAPLTRLQRRVVKAGFDNSGGKLSGDELLLKAEAASFGLDPRTYDNAIEMGIDPVPFSKLSCDERKLITARWRRGTTGEALFIDGQKERGSITAAKLGLTWKEWDALTHTEKGNLRKRYKCGARGALLHSEFKPKLVKTAKRIGVKVELWSNFTDVEKARIRARFNSGKRGNDLLKGFELAA